MQLDIKNKKDNVIPILKQYIYEYEETVKNLINSLKKKNSLNSEKEENSSNN